MRTLRVIEPNGETRDVPYEKKEPPIEVLQDLAGGYVEHVPVTYEDERRSAYVVDPFDRLRITAMRDRSQILAENPAASKIVGQRIRGRLIIDMGKEKKRA